MNDIGKRVLLAEDAEESQMIFESFLSGTPHELTIVDNGLEAVLIFDSDNFDIVFMDIMMPKMDGHKATKAIRKLEAIRKNKRIPIIALTGNNRPEDIEKSMEAGCDYHQKKPVQKVQVLNLISEFTK